MIDEEEYEAECAQRWQETIEREVRLEREMITSLVTACRALQQRPTLPRLQAMMKACGGMPIRRQRLKELLTDYLR